MPDEPTTTATTDHDLDQPLIIICQLESGRFVMAAKSLQPPVDRVATPERRGRGLVNLSKLAKCITRLLLLLLLSLDVMLQQ